MKKALTIFLTLFLCLSLTGCLLRPYRFDVQQGNAVEADQVDRIRVGMHEDQVQFILGTPMLRDVFHPNRWDYIYYLKPGYGKVEENRVAIYFDRGKVERIVREKLS